MENNITAEIFEKFIKLGEKIIEENEIDIRIKQGILELKNSYTSLSQNACWMILLDYFKRIPRDIMKKYDLEKIIRNEILTKDPNILE